MIDAYPQYPRPLAEAQQPVRQAEQDVRSNVVELAREAGSQVAVARALHLAPQTLSSWINRAAQARPRGRPVTRVDPMNSAPVTELLDVHGRSIGLPTLKELFHEVPRSALQRIREDWSAGQEIDPARLHWTSPGSVWATDFTQMPLPIDGVFPYVLVVRDLASCRMLLATPCVEMTSQMVVSSLRHLFIEHDAPLVLKSDNGSPFIAHETRCFCRQRGVVNLLSPPLTPQYNGSIEAAGGQLKARAALIARQQSCETWSSDILEAARLGANALNRPWGSAGPTPDQRWAQRQPITTEQRQALATLIDQKNVDITQSIQRERTQKGINPEFTAADRATVARTATRQALVELGYLRIRRPQNMSTKSQADLSRN
jgi:transposase InsO family protein